MNMKLLSVKRPISFNILFAFKHYQLHIPITQLMYPVYAKKGILAGKCQVVQIIMTDGRKKKKENLSELG